MVASTHHDCAVVLSGGGARAAYQVGVLRAIARITDRLAVPFGIICGTSAGAINAAALAARADNFRAGVARLTQLWHRITVDQVYRADLATVSTHGMRWLAAVVGGGHGPVNATAMLDNAPLRTLLEREIATENIGHQIAKGHLRALAINATSYSSGHAVTFYQGAPSISAWKRTRRRGVAAKIAIDHLLASTAIPFIFPAARVENDYYADGSVRQIAPLSPALHLGAKRMLVIAVGQFAGQRAAATPSNADHAVGAGSVPPYPSFAQVAGHALSSIFLDNLGADLERMWQVNQLTRLVAPTDLARRGLHVADVDALILGPSSDLGQLAIPFAKYLPTGVRYLLHGLGGTGSSAEAGAGNLLSYLLFDRHYCRALIALGFSDALARRDEIQAFLTGDTARFVPVFPPDFSS